ncbi:MAG: hypothetical protein D6748_01210 [Calditrichaeota bacterium]|nr:MAG: hypothetical protein D6748_01210 [Calditrichota bacterium]
MAAKAKGSIVLKLLIVVLAAMLWATITIPNKIWTEEKRMTTIGRKNLETVYEAERFYYTRTNSYLPADSLEKLAAFIQNDSTIQVKQKINELTNALYNSIHSVLELPVFSALVPISQAVDEINGDLQFNTRYFNRYDHLVVQKDDILRDLEKFNTSVSFPNFARATLYVDSLYGLQERINEEDLQTTALLALRYVDSLEYLLPNVEMTAVDDFWGSEYTKIFNFVKDIKKTDLVKVTSVADRLKKFIDRINTAMKEFQQIDIQQNINLLDTQKQALSGIYNDFITHDNFLITQQPGILRLDEVDSMLIGFNQRNFTCPDTFDGTERYIISYKPNSTNLVVECPNLLNTFHERLMEATTPLQQVSWFPYLDKVRAHLDSTINYMNFVKERYRLIRLDKSGEVVLNLKEIVAEMQSLDNVLFYRYSQRVRTFIDTVQTEKKLSVLKPMVEDLLNPLDTLATRVETRQVGDLEKRLQFFGQKIQALDSLIDVRIKKDVPAIYPEYEKVFGIVEELKSTFNPQDAVNLRNARSSIEESLLEALNGYHERVYGVFTKKHINHGYISNGTKSWESED